jgi:hypothetical protein
VISQAHPRQRTDNQGVWWRLCLWILCPGHLGKEHPFHMRSAGVPFRPGSPNACHKQGRDRRGASHNCAGERQCQSHKTAKMIGSVVERCFYARLSSRSRQLASSCKQQFVRAPHLNSCEWYMNRLSSFCLGAVFQSFIINAPYSRCIHGALMHGMGKLLDAKRPLGPIV